MVRYAVRVNGLTQLAVTKLDVLDTLERIAICTGYEIDGEFVEHFPGDIAVLVQTHRQGSLVKRVLATWGIGSVELAQASVFSTGDAEQLERVLAAIDAPGDLRRLRAARRRASPSSCPHAPPRATR